MRTARELWVPAIILVGGALILFAIGQQARPQLRAPLATALPSEIRGIVGRDAAVSDEEAIVAGFTDYAFRIYGEPEVESPEGVVDGRWASVYLGFYDTQTDGQTIHSPKNCLPGSGWEAISSTTADIAVGGTDEVVTVNRYILQSGDAQALVLYWYQGRGRVAHNEYVVKWDLLRDAALKRRTDEALVRIVVPIFASEQVAFDLAEEIAQGLVARVEQALPSA